MNQKLEKFGKLGVQRVRELLADLDINAFGNLSNSINYVVTEKENFDNLTIKGDSYFSSALIGRDKNKTNSGGLFEAIQRWVKLGKYGINPNNKGIAYAITKTIAREGSYKFRNKNIALRNKKALDELIDRFVEDVSKEYAKSQSTQIVNRIKLVIK
jgi:hypothetical protein